MMIKYYFMKSSRKPGCVHFKEQKIGKSHKNVNKCLTDHLANVIVENILFSLGKTRTIKLKLKTYLNVPYTFS